MSQSDRFSRHYWLRLGRFTTGVVAIAAVALLIHFIYLQLEAFVTPHRNPHVGMPAELERPYQTVTLTTADGLQIAGWYVPGTLPQGIVLVHGIDANRRAVLPEAAILAEAGYHLLLIDLRGHGQSDDSLATYGYREALDVQAGVDYLAAQPAVAQIGVLGTSYGGAAVVRAAVQDSRLAAIVVESSYSSLADAVEDAFEDLSIFPKWPFAPLLVALAEWRLGLEVGQVDSSRDLARLECQAVMIIHGRQDRLFPVHHAEKMYAAAHQPKTLWLIDGMGHANPVHHQEAAYRQRVLAFFSEAFAARKLEGCR